MKTKNRSSIARLVTAAMLGAGLVAGAAGRPRRACSKDRR